MTEQTEALKMAIEYAQDIKRRAAIVPTYHDALIQVCKKALEQSQQEPVALVYSMQDGYVGQMVVKNIPHKTKLYTHPAPSWQGLSDDEVKGKLFGIRFDRHTHNLMSNPPQIQYSYTITENELFKFARAIEQALKEKNT